MEEKKSGRLGGSKVSEIANIFQGRVPSREDIITPLRTKPKTPTSSTLIEKNETDSPSVTVMRTESHVARFNNARALFEKLGEENRSSKERIIPLQSTKSASSVLDARSRSSSASSDVRDTKSRSPSPKGKTITDQFVSNSVPVLNDNVNKSNGYNNKSNTQHDGSSVNESVIRTVLGSSEERTKPSLMKKPEKPERKFNSKELIEKQRNWTSHFSKTRSNRYNSDPNKSEIKLAVNNGNKDASCDNKSAAARSSSFSSRVRSPPTSPPSPPVRTEASKRSNVVRRERPTSVIPSIHSSPLKRDHSSPAISPSNVFWRENLRKERATSLIITDSDRGIDKENLLSPIGKYTPRSLFKKDDVENKRNDVTDNKSTYQDNLQTTAINETSNESRSPVEETGASKENLSGISGSLSSLSPPSSPGKTKTANEKQEDESNEKSSFGKYFAKTNFKTSYFCRRVVFEYL